MFDTQADLLSYAHLHSDVDELFRAYLDTALMELAQNHIGDAKGYWTGVVTLRHEKLSYPNPPDPPASKKAANEEPSIAELINAMPSGDEPTEAFQYLYWFEVRSDYWSRVTSADLSTLSGVLSASQRLEMFYAEARALEKRIEKIDQLKTLTEVESVGPKGTISTDTLPQEGFEGLLAKVVSPAGNGKS
jgi:hypothetical protein